MSLLLHESEVEPRTRVNNKDVLRLWGVNWFLLQSSYFYQKINVMKFYRNACNFILSEQLDPLWPDFLMHIDHCTKNVFINLMIIRT